MRPRIRAHVQEGGCTHGDSPLAHQDFQLPALRKMSPSCGYSVSYIYVQTVDRRTVVSCSGLACGWTSEQSASEDAQTDRLTFIRKACPLISKMAQLVRTLIDGYHDIMDNKSDPRVNDWLLMSSPFPTLAICLSYAYFVKVLGPRIMDSRKPMNLRTVLIVYNFVQVVFSAWLFYESLAAGWLFHYSYRCQPVDYSNNPQALRMARGCWWYYFSKFTEFFDTIFFVLRKKNDHISTLHVIHHGVMPMSVWFGVKFTPGGHSTFFGMLNTFVHIIMYTYYLFAAFGPRFQKYLWWKKYLTLIQMVQFVLVMIHAFQLLFIDCNYPKAFVWWIGLHAVMFYFLFADFYKQAYKKKLANKQAISEAKTQKQWNPQQEQNSFLRMNGEALYEQHDAPPSSYTTEPRHRAFVNGVTTK